MSTRQERLSLLTVRAAREREELAAAIDEVRVHAEAKYRRVTSLGFWAGTLAAGATSAYRFFGRNSFSARVNRWSTLGSLSIAVLRFLIRLFR
jgi:hypothetical protein